MQDEDTNINSLLFMMASISPLVRESIERESYRDSALPDESTQIHILEDAFSNLIKDLETIGLSFDIEMSDYVDDSHKLSKFIELVKYILPGSFYDILKIDSQIRQLIENIVNGSIGSNNTFIQVYLIELAGLDGNIPIKPELIDFIDQIYPLTTQTEIFSDYLKNMIDLYNQERPTTTTDSERHIAYREIMKEKIGDFSYAVNKFEGYEYFSELLKIQNVFIRDLLAPDNFNEYSYLFLEDKHDLPQELQENYDRKWYHYHVSHRWSYPYFEIRNTTPSLAEQVAIACYNYMFNGMNRGAYDASMIKFRKDYPDQYKIDEKIFLDNQETQRV